MDKEKIEILKRSLLREKAARKQAEKILEDKSRELYFLSDQLKNTNIKLESLLEEKSSQLEGVFKNILDAFLVINLKGEILEFNDAAIKMFGYDMNIQTLNALDLIYKEDMQYALSSFLGLQNRGFFKNYEARVYTKSKQVKWVQINATLIYDKNNKPIAAQGIIRDITPQREKSLIINMINDVAKSILGTLNIYEIAKVITSNIAKYLGTNDCVIYIVNSNDETVEQIAAFGAKLDHENKIINKIIFPINQGISGRVAQTGTAEIVNDTSKDERYIVDEELRLSEMTVPIIYDGEVIGIIDSEHPDKNHFTKEHLQTIENVASLVALQLKSAINFRERVKAEEENAELLKALENNNNELQEYAHIVSHDLKSPLRSIDALVSWIKSDNDGKLDNITTQNLELIETTLETMEQLIVNILDYSSAGTILDAEIDVDLSKLVDKLLKSLLIPKNVSVVILNKLPIVSGDKTKFQQLFQNLISNAIKFSNKGNGLIEIDFQENNSFYQFSVKDNGIGIEKKYHEKIFKIFHSLSNSKESTGVGLSIVKKIVELYDGNIWLESKPNIGTTFYFTIKKN